MNGFREVTSRVKDVGVGLTSIQTGVFTDYFFDLKYVDLVLYTRRGVGSCSGCLLTLKSPSDTSGQTSMPTLW